MAVGGLFVADVAAGCGALRDVYDLAERRFG
jgi:hypothetical protein